jgi:toxin ParE1/3/4
LTRSVAFHELAERELNDVARYYSDARPGLGSAFLDAVEEGIEALVATPGIGSPLGGEIRAWRLRKFPYSIIYRALGESVRVLAIARHRRRPFYWAGRD